ncbi:unnamed protein product [Urochloa decumbens]|uniref:Interferon-related developmental regulator N-terminal domain-containing protein n=1 Tax=Urochloa decumbens TaxID=240449 RepID=A0ABC9D6Z4_9POAL
MARNGDPDEKFELLDECIRNLQDRHDYWREITRSPATREAAMARIVGELEDGHLPFDKLDMRCFTIFALSGVSIKKGTPKEARLAYRVVGLLLLTLRDGSPGPLVGAAFPMLSKAIQAPHDDAQQALAAAAGIECLAVACFTGARDMEEAMEAIWRVIVVPPVRSRSAKLKIRGAPETSPLVLAAAVSAWTFLLSPDHRRLRHERAAEGCRPHQLQRGHRIAAYVDNDEPPTASWEWHDMMKVSTWVRLVQLNFLRRFLGNGFLRHVQGNPVLNEAFCFGRVEGKPLSIQKEESNNMLIDDLLRDVNRSRFSCWSWDNIFNLPGRLGNTKSLTEKLLQLGWD